MAPAAQGHTTYPLSALFASADNVRKKRPLARIMRIAQSIAHGGLLQNLVVVPEVKDGKRTGRAAVTAGETRRLALGLLRDGKVPDTERISPDYPVPVREVLPEEGAATSATENILRDPMHPAEQFEAFATLYEQCGSIEEVAAMFSVTPLVVKQRLKLAAASPALFQLFCDDAITLEQLMALCISDDHAAQERVWNAARGRHWEQDPGNLRRALTADEVASTSPIARFVGLTNYEKAGGAVRTDLFGEDDTTYLCAPALVKTLAEEKLEKAAAPLRAEGWAWVEVRAQATSMYDVTYARAQKGLRPLTEDERAKMAALEAEQDAADRARDDLYEKEGEEDLTEAEEAEVKALGQTVERARSELATMRDALSAWTPDVLAHGGALVTFDQQGKVVVCRGLIRPQDRKAAAKAAGAAQAARKAEGEGGATVGAADRPDEPKAGVSEALARRLTAHRTVALQRALADNTQVALAALAQNLVQRVLDDKPMYQTITALDLQAKGCAGQLEAVTEGSVKSTRAWTELQDLRTQWGERMPGEPARLLGWLIALPMSDLCDLIALCVAYTLDAIQPNALRHSSDALADAVGLDMADWWEPTPDEYLARVPKAMICQALSESGLSAEAATTEKLKKGEAVAKAEQLLKGKRWLPTVLKPRG